MSETMDEFSLIDLLATTLEAKRGAYEGVGDDAAILDVPAGRQLVVTTDTLVENVHFEAGAPPADIGYKSLAVNLSDLAAMGAAPGWYLLALTLPSMDADWAQEFALGMNELAKQSGILPVGGDVTSGPLSITVTACGLVRPGMALLRSGARPGDIIGISGPTGLAARAVLELKQRRIPAPGCLRALRRPVPRLELGQAIAGLAHSCIDVSDGVLADLGHIVKASGVGAVVELARLPTPAELSDLAGEDRWDLQLGGGDDYELCFTAPPVRWEEIQKCSRAVGTEVTAIGEVVEGEGCTCLRPEGGEYRPRSPGYVHGVRT